MTGPGSPMEAGWFPTAAGPLFGCYHPPAPDRSRPVSVLMCDPFGSDRMNLHLTYRALAEQLAAAGFATLRFDYPGTCDSSGYPSASARVAMWLDSIAAAADFLVARSGRRELMFFGALLGGTLALNAVAARRDVSGVLLWGALPTGRQFLREVRAFSAMTTANPEGRRPRGWRDGDQEAIGFLIPAEMAAELNGLRIPDLSKSSLRTAALFRRNAAFPVEPIAKALESAEVEVVVQEKAVVDMTDLVAEKALPPRVLLDDMVAWCERSFPETSVADDADAEGCQRLQPNVELASPTGAVVEEQVVRFGDDGGIFGILCHAPSPSQRLGTAIVLVNGGSNHRVGINRNYTDWARRWASLGCTVLRMDIRGLGDSPPRRPEDLGILYREETRDDVTAALDLVGQTETVDRIVCMGLCAGGYQSLQAALLDRRISGVVLLNPLRFRPVAEGHVDVDLQYAPVAHYVRAWRDPARWGRVLRGEVAIFRVFWSVVRRLAGSLWARFRTLWGTPPRGTTWLAARLFELTDRGCFVHVLFDSSDPMCDRTLEELARDRAELQATGKFSFEPVADTDHIFSPLWSQEWLTEALDASVRAWLAEPVPEQSPSATSNHGRQDVNLLPNR